MFFGPTVEAIFSSGVPFVIFHSLTLETPINISHRIASTVGYKHLKDFKGMITVGRAKRNNFNNTHSHENLKCLHLDQSTTGKAILVLEKI